MRYLKTFESHSSDDVLIVVDVQKSFKKFFTEDYLYDDDPEVTDHSDLYDFPNQADIIEKRYNYDVDADFYKNVLSDEVYREVSDKEDTGQLRKGDFFPTKEGTLIINFIETKLVGRLISH